LSYLNVLTTVTGLCTEANNSDSMFKWSASSGEHLSDTGDGLSLVPSFVLIQCVESRGGN